MSWECGYCNRSDDQHDLVDAICHHCGVLVCREHAYRLLDQAFGGPSRFTGRVAVHCARCWRAHHPRAIPLVNVFHR